MRKNSYGKILKGEPKEQHLSTVPKSCLIYIHIYIYIIVIEILNKLYNIINII